MEEEETDWSRISRSDQRSYIKLETLQGNPPTEIHNALHEVCWDSVVDLAQCHVEHLVSAKVG